MPSPLITLRCADAYEDTFSNQYGLDIFYKQIMTF